MNLYKKTLSLTIFLASLTNLLRVIQFGPITALGGLTIVLAFASWLLLLIGRKIPKAVFVTSWLVLFVLVSIFSFAWFSLNSKLPIVNAIQNLSVFIAFVGLMLLSITQSHRAFDSSDFISKALTRATKISVVLYWLSVIIGGPGTSLIMGARPFALYAIFGSAWFLAKWRYRLQGGLTWSVLTTAAIAFSFSRTALIITLLLFPLSQISLNTIKGWLRLIGTFVLIITVSHLAFTYVEPIRSRFTEVGDNATVGGVQINTSGRNQAWPVAYASAWKSPWIGQGPGSVSEVLRKRVGPAFSHPHNDYLRIFHDYGCIGLTSWLLGFWGIVIKTWRNWQWADRNDRANAHVHLAAFLFLIAVAIAMISDNVVVYLFSMGPVGIIVGASLGSASRRKKFIKASRKSATTSGKFKQLAIES